MNSINVLKTLVIFAPGVKYDINKPLLKMFYDYFDADKVVFKYDFDQFDDSKIEEQYTKIISELKTIDFKPYNEIIFVGKSLGSYFLGKARTELGLKLAKFICLTPLDITIPFLYQTDYILYGTNDQYLSIEARNSLKYKYVNLSIVDNANHSLKIEGQSEEDFDKLLKRIKLEALTYLEASSYME